MKKIFALSAVTLMLAVQPAFSACEITQGGKASSFDGKSIPSGVQVEKKSLVQLSKEHGNLKVMEQMYSGAITVCTDCKDNFIACK
jgi:hypothetical protein